VTICRSYEDIVAEKEATDENYDVDEDDGEETNMCGSGDCMCSKSPEDFPEWKWLLTRKGVRMVADLKNEAEKRDQDAFDQYHYNDYSAHGFQEVVENHVSNPHPLSVEVSYVREMKLLNDPTAPLLQQRVHKAEPQPCHPLAAHRRLRSPHPRRSILV
jgi:hypothetical protein